MALHAWQRCVIEEAFGRPVTNRYGCEEVSLIACECEEHRGLHLNADGVYGEVVPDDRPAPGPAAGRLLVTDLTNRAMPLVRYQVGDVVVPTDRRALRPGPAAHRAGGRPRGGLRADAGRRR